MRREPVTELAELCPKETDSPQSPKERKVHLNRYSEAKQTPTNAHWTH